MKKKTVSDIIVPQPHQLPEAVFEDLYIAVRKKEGRLYTNDQVSRLPEIDASHKYYREWALRKRSSERLVRYLSHKKRFLNILEIGCGNGWLSAKLADIPNSRVTGLDINQVEIDQAKQVFKKQNLKFIYDTFNQDTFTKAKFDVVVFAASVQYFKSLGEIMDSALSVLKKNGEVHLVDTHFYQQEEVEKCAGRSKKYYESMGCPEMTGHYFHHSIGDLKPFKHKILVNPNGLLNRLRKKDIFYWIAIRNK